MLILSIKGNSVRVRTGIVTFDVLICSTPEGRHIMKVPKNVYIASRVDFEDLARLTINAYLNTVKGECNTDDTEKVSTKVCRGRIS